MSWEQVRDLRRRGFSIGGHTVDHVDLGCAGADEARLQLADSRRHLREQLGEDVELFAYPFGRVENITEDNRRLVAKGGFRCCASCHGGLVEEGIDPYRLPRVALSSWYADTGRFALDLALGRL
jgi:peptidoglycan/xylan/chitin deacetylase (PgdA/CDA1 family)